MKAELLVKRAALATGHKIWPKKKLEKGDGDPI
jgi:hypothetical protein